MSAGRSLSLSPLALFCGATSIWVASELRQMDPIRDYQAELLAYALAGNSIVFLDTGACTPLFGSLVVHLAPCKRLTSGSVVQGELVEQSKCITSRGI
jgi:hypothetical protein